MQKEKEDLENRIREQQLTKMKEQLSLNLSSVKDQSIIDKANEAAIKFEHSKIVKT